MNRIYLRFVGPGRIPDIPPRDLTVEEINQIQYEHPEIDDIALALVGTGYYEFVKSVSRRYPNKALWPTIFNK